MNAGDRTSITITGNDAKTDSKNFTRLFSGFLLAGSDGIDDIFIVNISLAAASDQLEYEFLEKLSLIIYSYQICC